MSQGLSVQEQRRLIRRLVDDSSAADAPTAYYSLFHDAARSALYTRVDDSGQVLGFVARCQTGIDLFRPLVTLRCHTAEVAADLLHEALIPNRPYLLFAGLNQLSLVSSVLHIEASRVLQIYTLNPARFEPVINVLVQCRTTPDGTPRCEIHSGGLQAVAGVNWQSPAFAELYVFTDEAARERGWGISVASAVTQMVLESGRLPIYLVEHDNESSRHLAEKLGYSDTGARQVYADVVYRGQGTAP